MQIKKLQFRKKWINCRRKGRFFMEEKIKDGDKSLAKLFEIIEAVGESRSGMKGRDIAEKTGYPVSTTFRMLKFLAERGYLRSESSLYTLGPGLIRLGAIASSQNPLLRISRPFLAELSEKTMETVHLAELRNDSVVYIDKVEGSRSVRMISLIGSRGPLYCTGVGKVILAHLPENRLASLLNGMTLTPYTKHTIRSKKQLRKDLEEIRRQGYAVDDCEHELGVFCIAAPILDYSGNIAAGISISGSELYLRSRKDDLALQVKKTAEAISLEFSRK